MDPGQVVLQLAAEILEVLAPLEMSEHLVEQQQLRIAAGHQAPDAGEIVHLADSPGEGGLAALIGAGHDKNAFGAAQVEVVEDDRPVPRRQDVGQRDVECLAAQDVLRPAGNLRVAEFQPGPPESRHEVDAGDVKLHLPVEHGNRPVKIIAMTAAVIVERREDVGIQLRDQVQDARFDVVHVGQGKKFCPVILHLPLPEPLERSGHVGAVVSLRIIFADLDPVAEDTEAISYSGQLIPECLRIGGEPGECAGLGIGHQVLAEGQEAMRPEVGKSQVAGQRGHGIAICFRRVQEPLFPLIFVVEPHGLREAVAHGPHILGKCSYPLEQILSIKVAQYLMTVGNRLQAVQ